MRSRLGCLSRGGLVACLLTLVVVALVLLLWGGRPFSPGPLKAEAGDAPLGGVLSHAQTGGQCSACHTAPWSQETMSNRCLACHAEIGLQLQDATSLHGTLMAHSEPFACYTCHVEHQGANAALTIIGPGTFPHMATGYSLQGHGQRQDGAAFTCTDCHGQDLTHFAPEACANCHGSLDADSMRTHIEAFGRDCLACHDGLDTYGRQFDHNQLAWPLLGQHTLVACTDCHPGARSLADLRATPEDCYGCHQQDDAHDGQLGQDCAQCHAPEEWQAATFDHALAAFPLQGRHQGVDCRECHTDNVYKGTPRDCFPCHQADDAHGGQLGQDCAQCHTPEDWGAATFEHSLTVFPLQGRHQGLDCRECHADQVYKGTPQDCLSCHRQDDAHDGQLGQDCAQCHTPEDWQAATFDHALAAFPLTGAHSHVECVQCHVNGVFRGTPKECLACHGEPAYHAGLLGSDCAACHTTDAWAPASYNRAHAFPLDHGEEGPSPCQTCHPANLGSYTCYDCHDPAEIEDKHRDEGISDLQDCIRCHPSGTKDEARGKGDGGGDGGGDN